MTDIRVKDTGPIEEFAYNLQGYGLHVLLGPQGAGKTTVLRSVQLAVDGRTDIRPSKRDGAPRGEIQVGGKTIRIMRQVREEGELSVEGLGDVSIADLHSPAYKDATTRDRHRITTLVRLAGVKADASLFWGLIGGQDAFEALVPHDSLTTDDLVEMAARTKRAFERQAQALEERRDTELANARAQASIAEGIDTSLPYDTTGLQDQLEQAIRAQSQFEADLAAICKAAADAAEVNARAEQARARLQELGCGTTVDEAQEKLAVQQASLDAMDAEIAKLKGKLVAANTARREVELNVQAAQAALDAAKREESLQAELTAAIDAGGVDGPDEEDVELAKGRVAAAIQNVAIAKHNVTMGVKIREALAAKERSGKHTESANKLAVRAQRMRNAARDTFEVLTNAIASINDCPLRVALSESGDPRLVLATDRDESEPFDRLSDGQKWSIVVRLAAGHNRLIVLPQAAYGELSPSTRRSLHELAKQHRTYILTAIADDCPLHGESFESQSVEAAE